MKIKKGLIFPVIFLLLINPLIFQVKGDYSKWDYKIKITINHNYIDEVLNDFPVLVYLNSSRINWDNVLDNLNDIRFTVDNQTNLKFEIEDYTINSEAWIWVKIPQISNVTDTVFYMVYGNTDVSSGEDAKNVWNSNYVMVQHLNDASNSTIIDSTSNNNDGTKKDINEPAEIVGQISNAQDFDGSNDYINCGNNAILNITGDLTIEAWCKFDSTTQSAQILTKNPVNDAYHIFIESNYIQFRVKTVDGGVDTAGWAGDALTVDIWYYITATYKLSTGKIYIYKDTAQYGNGATGSGNIVTTTGNLDIGRFNSGYYFNGQIDEVRISNSFRSSSWIKASYNAEIDNLLTYTFIAEPIIEYATKGVIISALFILLIIGLPLLTLILSRKR